jgi:hypothetical protein
MVIQMFCTRKLKAEMVGTEDVRPLTWLYVLIISRHCTGNYYRMAKTYEFHIQYEVTANTNKSVSDGRCYLKMT